MRDQQSGEKKLGFIDKAGRLVIGFERLPKTTVAVGDFHEGRARIYLGKILGDVLHGNMDATVGFIDETGKVIIEPRFETARDFSEGLAYLEIFRGVSAVFHLLRRSSPARLYEPQRTSSH